MPSRLSVGGKKSSKRILRLVKKYLTASLGASEVEGSKSKSLRMEILESRDLLTAEMTYATSFAGLDSEEGFSIVSDVAGNSYSTGYYRSTVDFDPGPQIFNLTSVGNEDVYISKLDATGNFVWAKSVGGDWFDGGVGIGLDADGSVYVCGTFSGTVDFDPGPGTFELTTSSSNAMFILKLDSNGNFAWAKQVGQPNDVYVKGLKIDGANNVLVTGTFLNTADFDPGPGIDILQSVGHDPFILKLDSNGNYIWAKHFEGFGVSVATDIAIDSEGNIYTTGFQVDGTESRDFDPGAGTFNLSGLYTYISKLDSTGQFVWAKAIGGRATATVADHLNNVYTIGNYVNREDFDPGPGQFFLDGDGLNDRVFISKLNSAGNFVWAKPLSSAKAYDLDVDKTGNIVLSGSYTINADLDPGPGFFRLDSFSQYDMFVEKLTPNGVLVWAAGSQGIGGVDARGLDVDALGNIYLTGTMMSAGGVDFDPGPGSFIVPEPGGTFVSSFVCKWNQNLKLLAPNTSPVDWTIRRNGVFAEVYDNASQSIISSVKLNSVSGIEIVGAEDFSNRVTIDLEIGGAFFLANGIRIYGKTATDELVVKAANAYGLTYRPSSTSNGLSQIVAAGNSILFENVEQITAANFAALTIETQNSRDNLTLEASMGLNGAVATKVSGSSDDISIVPIIWSGILNVTINTGEKDSIVAGAGNDSVRIMEGGLAAASMKNLTVNSGRDSDLLSVTNDNLLLPAIGGRFAYSGGSEVDKISVSGDSDWYINNQNLTSINGGNIRLTSIEESQIEGGIGDNILSAVAFTGYAILLGGDGDDILRGGSFHDSLFGGNGNDVLIGNNGHDYLDGQDGDDRLYGGNGNDTLRGGAGADFLMGDLGNDALDGQQGSDTLRFDGTSSADSLRLQYLNPTSTRYTRKLRNQTTNLELDTITNDSSDFVRIYALGGDDLISVDLSIVIDGLVDGGDGTDSCTAPLQWTKISC